MLRLGAMVLVVVVVGVAAEQLLAANWPPYRPDPAPHAEFRGPGHYLSEVKVLLPWFLFLLWVWTTDWVSRDVQAVKLKWSYLRWNPIIFGSFMLGFLLLWLIPYFWLGFVLLAISYVAPLTTYIILRNSEVTNDQRVLTREHLRYVFASKLHMFGVKMQAEAPDPHRTGPPVVLFMANQGHDQHLFRANLIAYFALIEIYAIANFGWAGALSRDIISHSAVLIPSMLLGTGVGFLLGPRIPDKIFRNLIFIVLLVIGVALMVNSLGK